MLSFEEAARVVPTTWEFVYVLPNKVAANTATAVTENSIL